jgi:predicted DNA binding protein
MESVTAVMRQADGFHPISRACEELPFTRGTIHQFSIQEDGSAVVLRDVRGDLDCARHVIESDPTTLGYSVSGGSEGEGLAYVHARPTGSIEGIIRLPREHELILDFPLEGLGETEIRVTMISDDRAVLREALADVPEDVDVTVERVGGYPPDPDARDVSALLTERQREILDVALDLGYYDVPRRATHADIAERADLSPSTVSEHMQKIEARAFGALAG